MQMRKFGLGALLGALIASSALTVSTEVEAGKYGNSTRSYSSSVSASKSWSRPAAKSRSMSTSQKADARAASLAASKKLKTKKATTSTKSISPKTGSGISPTRLSGSSSPSKTTNKTVYVNEHTTVNNHSSGSSGGGLVTGLVLGGLVGNALASDSGGTVTPTPPATAGTTATASTAETVSGPPAAPLKATPLDVYTGSKGGVYASLCSGDPDKQFKGLKATAKQYGLEVNCHNSKGGTDNLNNSRWGNADAFPVQADSLLEFKSKYYSFGPNEYAMYQEPFVMLTGKNSGIDSLSDIDSNSNIYVVGSAEKTWNAMARFASDDTFLGMGGNSAYGQAVVKRVLNWEDGLDAVSKNHDTVLFAVMSVDSERIKAIDKEYGDLLRLIPVDDDRFLDITDGGSRVYSTCEIPSGKLPNLQSDSFWGGAEVETLCTDALFVVDQKWVDKQPADTKQKMGYAITEMLEELPLITQTF